MELNTIKDAFDRVAKKQNLSCSKTLEVINQVGQEIEQAMAKMQSTDNGAGCSDQKSILLELKTNLNEMAPMNQLEGSQRELNVGLVKYAKILEKYFNPGISKEYQNIDFDIDIVNQIIASHFYHQGLFDLGDCFVREANDQDAVTLKSPFLEMYGILEAMKSRDLEPALDWASKHSEMLLQNGSTLQLKLHQLQFVEILQKGSQNEALKYARTFLAPFASAHKVEIQKLMACLPWAGRLDHSPYAEFLSPTHWERLAEEFTQQFCSLLGQSFESPLSVAIAAGIQGLMAAKQQEWQAMQQLPVPELRFLQLKAKTSSRPAGAMSKLEYKNLLLQALAELDPETSSRLAGAKSKLEYKKLLLQELAELKTNEKEGEEIQSSSSIEFVIEEDTFPFPEL